ncbi:XcyI family restriction endonuclease [Desulfofundulus thermocisternus]|uniref:XcyI family restriction endonuclease n=1 Tax=Desulfofundulus thermocisternus TaxID=42471 RepID=UPI000481D11F|nr:XcyI family restriction endonuclease [Desulfofundulus thermocisternus]
MEALIPTKQLWIIGRLKSERGKILRDALKEAVEKVGVQTIDRELHDLVSSSALTKLGAFGLRGEILFAVPCLIKEKPSVSGYYRLVLGFSQKEYGRKGLGKWVEIEKRKNVSVSEDEIQELCATLIRAGEQLLNGVSNRDNITEDFFHELTLLTLGAQLDGSYRGIIGRNAVAVIRDLIMDIIKPRQPGDFQEKENEIEFNNAAGRRVKIRFGSDPDILISEYSGNQYRHLLAVEVKGGGDPSNIHNRLGEAEKSHLKLSASGVLRWTIVGVPVDEQTARQRSPSTNRFYAISNLVTHESQEYESFRRELISILGLPE